MSTRTLIVGCGFLGRRAGVRLARRGETVFGTARTPARAAELAALGIEPVVADVMRPATLAALPAVDRVLYSVGFDRGAGDSMRSVYVVGLQNALERLAGRAERLVYASSTGVYGQDDGGWVDEDAPTEPRHESGRVVLEGEEVFRRVVAGSGRSGMVLRFSGLYGPGRIVRRALLERGEPIAGDPEKYLNVVHIDDAAAAAVAALDRGQAGRTCNVSDDRPVLRREYYGLLAERLGVAPPRFEPPEPGSPGSARDATNKRVANRRMKAELKVELVYPDITTGLPAALAGDAR